MADTIDTLLAEMGKVHRLQVKGQFLKLFLTHAQIDPNVAKRAVKTIQVVLQTVEAAVEAGGDLIHPISPEESSVKRGNDGLALLHNLAV
jgi:hypothetical protein